MVQLQSNKPSKHAIFVYHLIYNDGPRVSDVGPTNVANGLMFVHLRVFFSKNRATSLCEWFR